MVITDPIKFSRIIFLILYCVVSYFQLTSYFSKTNNLPPIKCRLQTIDSKLYLNEHDLITKNNVSVMLKVTRKTYNYNKLTREFKGKTLNEELTRFFNSSKNPLGTSFLYHYLVLYQFEPFVELKY